MPNLSITTALLLLGNSEGLPWSSTTWQELSKVIGLPWATVPDAEPTAQSPNVPSWTTHIANSIQVYATNLWSKDNTKAKIKYSSHGLADNDAAGQVAWNKTWGLSCRIDDVFTKYKCSPYHALSCAKAQKV
jgi:hypothetical protein